MNFINIIDVIYSFFILILSKVLKNNDEWLFSSQGGKNYSGNPRFFFEWLLNNHKNEVCYWVTKNKSIYLSLKNKKIPVLYFYNIRNIITLSKARYIICSHSHTGNDVYKFISHKKTLVTLWHGIPLKKMGRQQPKIIHNLLPIKSEPDIFLVTSKRDADLFGELYNISPEKFFIGSYPRVINLISESKIKPTILYAPTFRDGMEQEYYDEHVFPNIKQINKLNDIVSKFNHTFIIKLHPYVKAILPNLNNFTNIKVVSPDEDIQNILGETKILITDYSSVYFDYLNLNRPIIFFTPDYLWYSQDSNRGLIYEYEDVTPGIRVKDWNDLIINLFNMLNGKSTDNYSENRKRVLNLFYTARNMNNSDLLSKCKSIKNNIK